uniref:Uncharacterized protein n=1 Tax=Romanomermis culicivorax TaxID=13658 RepID=A0A915K3Y4_ROMCU
MHKQSIVEESHITARRHNLIIVDETAAGQVSGVTGQFARHPHVTFARFQRINAANIVQTAAGYEIAARSVRGRHDPGAAQRYGVHLEEIKISRLLQKMTYSMKN